MKPKVGVICIGRLTSDDIREDFETIKQNIKHANFKSSIAGPVFDQLDVIDAAENLRRQEIDLLVLLPLHGAASEQQVLAAETCSLPTVIWTLPPRYSFPSGAIAQGALKDKGFTIRFAYGPPNSIKVREKIESLAQVAFTVNRLKTSRIGVVGRVLAPIVSSHYDQNLLRDKLGPYIYHINIADIQDALTTVSETDIQDTFKRVTESFQIDVSKDLIKKALKFHLALKSIVKDRRLDAVAVECWSELVRDFKINPCFGFMDDSYVISCEGDAVGAALLLMLKYLLGSPVAMLDIFTLKDNVLSMGGHCAAPASIARSGKDVVIGKREPPAMFQMKAELAMVKPRIPWTKVSLMRIVGRNMDRIHFARGEIVSTDRSTFMGVDIKLQGDVDKFIENLHGHHYAVAPGDLQEQMELLCDLLDLTLIVT